MTADDFEVRDVTIAHESIWNAMVVWARAHGMDLVRVMDSDDEHLASYVFTPRHPDKS